MVLETQTGAVYRLVGREGEEVGREAPEGGAICSPLAELGWVFSVAQTVKSL